MANSLSRYAPGTNVTSLPDVVDRLFRESFVAPSLFDRSFSRGTPGPVLPVNLFETKDSYIMHASLPGMTVDNLDIQVTGREVSIKGAYEFSTPEGSTVIWQGIPGGQFFETFTLPLEVQSDGVQATYENGILNLILPKAEHLRPKSIQIQVSK